eukprot:365390-Chlamydomonas_euryale.AAC.23
MTAPVLSQHHNIFRTPRGVARSHDQADLGPSYLARDGCTPSGDDSLQHSDAGVSMGGLSGGHGGPEDAMACEKTSNAMVMIQISPRAEITGSRSPSDLSVRLVGKPPYGCRLCHVLYSICCATTNKKAAGCCTGLEKPTPQTSQNQSQSQTFRELTHKGYACVERSMAKGIKQRAGHCHKGQAIAYGPEPSHINPTPPTRT